jgi:hypothetical protein
LLKNKNNVQGEGELFVNKFKIIPTGHVDYLKSYLLKIATVQKFECIVEWHH